MKRVAASIFAMLFAVAACVRADDDPQYELVRVDGSRETIDVPPQWIAREREPQIGDQPLLSEDRPVRSLHRLGASSSGRVGAGIELIGGDRLTGRVVEYLPEATSGPNRPAAMVVEPLLAVDEPLADEPIRIRVPIERVRRVVWDDPLPTPRPYRPGTFFYRDGRRTTFRSLRWEPGVVKLLLDQGVEEVKWDDAAEVHLVERDPWEEYADQLAVLSPDATAKLLRTETPGGTRVTTSLERLRVSGDVAKPESQQFELFPAWSLDPIRVPQRLIASQSFFAPPEVPLSNFEPTGYVHRSYLASGWNQWRADRNVQGNPLAADGREFRWGFGVHAYAALEFTLPPTARTFRTSAALDRAAGDGGCVRGRVYFGPSATAANPAGKPLGESPVLVGSSQRHDFGRLELRPAAGRVNRLILVADALPNDATTPGADPLDLRDVFDWLEPLVELDAAALKTSVAKHAASLFVRRHRWVAQGTYGDVWRWENASVGGQSRLVVAPLKSPLVVSRTLLVPHDADELHVYAATVDESAGPTTVKLVVSGQTADEAEVPTAAEAKTMPLRLTIPENRRGRELKYELHFTAEKPGLRVDFQGVETAAGK